MKIDIIDFYVNDRIEEFLKNGTLPPMIGTLHIRLNDFFEVRGMKVFYKKGEFKISMYHIRAVDKDKKVLFYPALCFVDRDKKKEMLDYIHKNAVPMIKKKMNLP